MIKNEQQMSITEEKLRGMTTQLARLRKKYADDAEYDFYSEGTRNHIEQMKRELQYYRLAKRGDVDALLRSWHKNGAIRPHHKDQLCLGDLISLLRVARGLTQAELAERLGLEQAHIARYERDDYSGYTVETFDRILNALGMRLTVKNQGHSGAA